MNTRNSSLPRSQESNGSIDDSLPTMQDERGRNQQPGGSNGNATVAEADTNDQTPDRIHTESRQHKKASNALIQMRALSKSRRPVRGGNAKGEFHRTYRSHYNMFNPNAKRRKGKDTVCNRTVRKDEIARMCPLDDNTTVTCPFCHSYDENASPPCECKYCDHIRGQNSDIRTQVDL